MSDTVSVNASSGAQSGEALSGGSGGVQFGSVNLGGGTTNWLWIGFIGLALVAVWKFRKQLKKLF